MKKVLMVVLLSVGGSVAAFATPSCASVSSGSLSNGTTLTDSIDTCTIADGQVFSNFSVYANTGFSGVPFSLAVTVSGDTLFFGTTNMGGTGEDIQIAFQTTPGISFVILQTGAGDSTTEIVCGTAFASPSETCSSGNLNTSVLSSYNGSTSTSNVGYASTDYFLKDDSGGSQVSQTFVPEPMTMSLMGVGLLGLGFLGRRLRK